MVDRTEARVGDHIEGLFAAIIRMRPPANVGEQTSRMAQPLLLAGFLQMRRVQEIIRPDAEILAVPGGARAQHVEIARRDKERVGMPLHGVKPLIEQACSRTPSADTTISRGFAAPNDLSITRAA